MLEDLANAITCKMDHINQDLTILLNLKQAKTLSFRLKNFTAISLNALRTIIWWSLSRIHMLEDLANAITRKIDHIN